MEKVSQQNLDKWLFQTSSGMDKAELFDLYHDEAFPRLAYAYTEAMSVLKSILHHDYQCVCVGCEMVREYESIEVTIGEAEFVDFQPEKAALPKRVRS